MLGAVATGSWGREDGQGSGPADHMGDPTFCAEKLEHQGSETGHETQGFSEGN